MNIFNHLLIAVRLKQAIEASTQVRLDTVGFLLGNIKPDLSSRYGAIPHFKKDSEEFVGEELQGLLDEVLFEQEACGYHFSERLGILVHYLSDFFCYAHSQRFSGSMMDHHQYEMRLFGCFLLHLKPFMKRCRNKTGTGFQDPSIAIRYNRISILRHVDRLHEEYCNLNSRHRELMDVNYTCRACTSLCLSVVTACMASEDSFYGLAEEVFS